jgi:hypothetical protein
VPYSLTRLASMRSGGEQDQTLIVDVQIGVHRLAKHRRRHFRDDRIGDVTIAAERGRLQVAYLALLAAVLLFRPARRWVLAQAGTFKVSYPNRPPVTVPRGHSVLEASRWARVPPHLDLRRPGMMLDQQDLNNRRIRGAAATFRPRTADARPDQGAAPRVLLACQLRPAHDIGVLLLLPQRAAEAATTLICRGRRPNERVWI